MFNEMFGVLDTVFTRAAGAFRDNPRLRPWFLIYPVGLIAIGVYLVLEKNELIASGTRENAIAFTVALMVVFTFGVAAFQKAKDVKFRTDKIQQIEAEVRKNPERTKAAWDLAQEKLESYLDKNLEQVRSIYWLCLLVMMFGFALVASGAILIYRDPTHLNASMLSAISGIIISFLGGSFIIIYKSTLSQAKEYVSMLERINAVGMSLQILDSLSAMNPDLKDKSKAEIAKELLKIYGIK